jgi:hypothetical protein
MAAHTTYSIAAKPRFAEFYAFSCACCGHEELERPVWLTGPEGVQAYGCGCAAKLLGWDRAVIEARIAATELLAIFDRNGVRNAWTFLQVCKPGRITPKFCRDMNDGAMLDDVTLATVIDAWRAINKVGAIRDWEALAI